MSLPPRWAPRSSFWHILRLPTRFFPARHLGDIGQRVGINDTVALGAPRANSPTNMVSHAAHRLLCRADAATAASSSDADRHGHGALVNICRAALRLAQTRGRQPPSAAGPSGKLAGASVGGLQVIETLKAGRLRRLLRALGRLSGQGVFNADQELHASALARPARTRPVPRRALNGAAIIGIGGPKVMDGVLTMGMLLAFQTMMMSFEDLVNARPRPRRSAFRNLYADVARLDDVLRYKEDPITNSAVPLDAPGAAAPPRRLPRIAQHFSSGYSRAREALIDGFAPEPRKPGRRVAVVGASGSGKSTVAKLVSGLYAAALGWRDPLRWQTAQSHPARRDQSVRGHGRSGYLSRSKAPSART